MKNQKAAKNAKGVPPYLVGPLTRPQFQKERKSAADLKYRPLERQVQSELNASDLTSARIPGYFQTYQQSVANLASGSQAAYDKANTNFQGYLNTAGQQNTAQQADIQARQSTDAQLRGVAVDPAVARDAVNAGAARQRLTSSIGGTIQGQGANQFAYLQDKQRIGQGEMINQLGAEAAHKSKIQQDARALAAEKGDFKASYKPAARESERKFYLANKTIGGENFRAKLSAQTSRSNAQLQAAVSRANNKLTTATSAGNSAAAIQARAQLAAAQRKLDKWKATHSKSFKKGK